MINRVSSITYHSFVDRLIYRWGRRFVLDNKLIATSIPFTTPNSNKEWTSTNIDWIDNELYYNNLTSNKIIFSIDGLFYPNKSHLVAAFILASVGL